MTMAYRTPRGRLRGFTLVEVLIVTVMTALLVGVLFSALSATGRFWTVAGKRADQMAAQRAGLSFMRREIAHLAPVTLRDGGENGAAFSGSEASMTFLAPIPAHRDVGGLFMVQFAVADGDAAGIAERKKLLFRYRRFESEDLEEDPGYFDDWKDKALLEGIESLSFEYLASATSFDEPGDGPRDAEWTGDWDGEGYPSAIRVSLALAGSDAEWPPMIFPVHAHNQAPQSSLLLDGGGRRPPEDEEESSTDGEAARAG